MASVAVCLTTLVHIDLELRARAVRHAQAGRQNDAFEDRRLAEMVGSVIRDIEATIPAPVRPQLPAQRRGLFRVLIGGSIHGRPEPSR